MSDKDSAISQLDAISNFQFLSQNNSVIEIGKVLSPNVCYYFIIMVGDIMLDVTKHFTVILACKGKYLSLYALF